MKFKLFGKLYINSWRLAVVLLCTAGVFAQKANTSQTKAPEVPAETRKSETVDSKTRAALKDFPANFDATTTAHKELPLTDGSSTVSTALKPVTPSNDFRAKRFSELPEATETEKFSALKSSKQTSSDDGWQFSFAPYLYATGISGTIGARGRVIEVDASFGNVLENLDIGLMGTFEARKGKLIFVSDLIWTKMSAERNTPGALFDDVKVGVNLFIFDPEVGYRVYENKAGSLDLLGGVRIWSVETNLNVRSGLLPGFDVSQRKTFAAPVVGVHGLLNLSRKFYVSSKFDIGGAGIGADLTTQFYGGGGFRITPTIALIGGYRYLQVDYDDSEGFLYDTRMNGLVFGAKFNF